MTKEEVARIDVVIGHYSEQREKERSGKAGTDFMEYATKNSPSQLRTTAAAAAAAVTPC